MAYDETFSAKASLVRPLPKVMQTAIAALSVTVQHLVYAVALHACGMPEEPKTQPDRQSWQPVARSDDTESLQVYLQGIATPLTAERCALGMAAIAGRTATEMERFYGWPCEDKLYRLRAAARRLR